MPLYADLPARRTRQVVADAGCLLVVVASVAAGRAVHAAVAGVAEPARRFADGSTALADGLRSTGGSLGRAPLVGDDVADLLGRSADSAASLARAAGEQRDAVLHLAVVLGLLTALLPIALVVGVRAVQRLRWAARVRDAHRLAGTAAGERVLALRALQRSPGEVLLGLDPDPATAWLRGEATVVGSLADLELAALGVRRARGLTAART
ncbi:hypothetical protein AB2L28_16690 [Kineococcus sp. TBRC 1896]|uniref:Uncharacterized protein n=1 Tax=Kineococcus mangrovi TaxID=1660183 RepID=A0ABV4I5C2_9ACTN